MAYTTDIRQHVCRKGIHIIVLSYLDSGADVSGLIFDPAVCIALFSGVGRNNHGHCAAWMV